MAPFDRKGWHGHSEIASWSELETADNYREAEIKKKTLELYRNDSRNIQILTYDELYERAEYIVENLKITKINIKLENRP